MIKKVVIILIVIGLIAGTVVLVRSYINKAEDENTNSFTATEIVTGVADVKIKQKADKDLAVAKAMELWRVKFIMGEDLSAGPCLSNEVIPDWVADVAHSPRQDVDNLPANQCPAYGEGTAHHFVELDPQGNLIRAE